MRLTISTITNDLIGRGGPAAGVIPNTPAGGNRTAVYVESGTFEGPRLRGKVVPHSGGDYAYFRPDDVAVFDARYMLEEEDGTLILLNNRGFLWGRKPDTMQRLRDWAFTGGEPVARISEFDAAG